MASKSGSSTNATRSGSLPRVGRSSPISNIPPETAARAIETSSLVQRKWSLNGPLFEELAGNRERIRVVDEEVAMHVITRRDARLGFLAAEKRMARILGYTAFIHQTNRVQHRTSIFVEEHIFADGVCG
jgi:hypothetical protein